MYTSPQLGKFSIYAGIGVILLTLSACTDTSGSASVETSVDNYCQNEKQLTPGTAEYETCIAERTDFVVQAARRGAVF